jgi:hypothetical protein
MNSPSAKPAGRPGVRASGATTSGTTASGTTASGTTDSGETSGLRSQAAGPLFVVSMWRSGSSLLYALLNKHPQVNLMYEADLLLLRPVFLKPAGLSDWAERWQFWNGAFERHGLNPRDVPAGISNFRAAFESVHKEYARRKGAIIWGDKSPNYYDCLRAMARVFPDAKFIIVWRDPEGTANSILRAAQMGNSYFKKKGAVLRGLLGYRVFKKECDWLVAHGKPVYQVSYEDLVSQTAAVMQEVCRFLEIPYVDELSSLQGADRSAIYDGQHHANVKGDKIVSAPRPNVVDENLRNKIDQYIVWWRRRYAGAWPPFPRVDKTQTKALGFFQRVKDKLQYCKVRAFDHFTEFTFCMAPLWLLRKYRDGKHSGKTHRTRGDAPVPGASPQ